MDTNWIEILAAVVTILSFVVVIYRINLSTQLKIHANSIEIGKINAEVTEVKKDIEKMKSKHDLEIRQVKTDFAALQQQARDDFRQWLNEHMEDHRDLNAATIKSAQEISRVAGKLEAYFAK